jgi:small subunit ribosomal protein S13
MINRNKNYFDELLTVAGLGEKHVIKLYQKYGLNTKFVEKKYKKKHLGLIKQNIKKGDFEKKLTDNVRKNIKFLIKIKNYKGNRHKLKYPVRGQRTHTNGKTTKKIKH